MFKAEVGIEINLADLHSVRGRTSATGQWGLTLSFPKAVGMHLKPSGLSPLTNQRSMN